MGCFSTILFLVGFVLVIVSMIRWFEQTTEAVDQGWWNKIALLVMFPFAVWFFPSRVAAGRSTPVPRHEPVRGFGTLPKARRANEGPAEAGNPASAPSPALDQPPPGTPKEFLGMPVVPPPKPRAKPAIDSDKIAKLKQKMREQGMLPPDDA
jgi:hypothetical protein